MMTRTRSPVRPTLVIVGGQTGAGKTAVTEMVKRSLGRLDRSINVNMDFYNPIAPELPPLAGRRRSDGKRQIAPRRPEMVGQGAAVRDREPGQRFVLESAMRSAAGSKTSPAVSTTLATGSRSPCSAAALSRLRILDG